jgi:predicted HAD superfamily Cof-like phosphohydrolase
MDLMADIAAFHKKFSLEYDGPPRQLPTDLLNFRVKFLKEELREYEDDANACACHLLTDKTDHANTTHLLEKQLDALVDLVYVALGTAYLQGFDFNEAWRRVQDANMAKVRAFREADSKRGSTYDVVKPEGWEPPSHTDLVENHAHRG